MANNLDTPNRAANQALQVYQRALKTSRDTTEAYNKALDYLIDKVMRDPELGEKTMKAVSIYDRKLGLSV